MYDNCRRFKMACGFVYKIIKLLSKSSFQATRARARKSRVCLCSGPSSYDRPDIRTTWVTTKNLVLTYDQSLELRPECWSRLKRVSACAAVNKYPRCVLSVGLSPDTCVCGRNFGQCSALYNECR
jgi:hypothetical protein